MLLLEGVAADCKKRIVFHFCNLHRLKLSTLLVLCSAPVCQVALWCFVLGA